MNDLQMPLLASILICTRNRASYLSHTIHVAAAQTLSDSGFEIVVVDNGSTDQTPAVVRECQSVITKISLRYIVETEVGLSAARNRAIREAKGQILCFLDDDAIPEPEWLQKLCAVFEQNENIMCAGGTIIPEYETTPPMWFDDKCEGIFAPKFKQSTPHTANYPAYPYGANYAVRASAFIIIGLFDTQLGYNGKSLLPGEETEFFRRIERAGYQIVVDPSAVVRHLIPSERLTKEYFLRRMYAQGRCDAIMHWRFDENPMQFGWKFHLWGVAYSLMRLVLAYGRVAKQLVLHRAVTMRLKLDLYPRKGYFCQEAVQFISAVIKT